MSSFDLNTQITTIGGTVRLLDPVGETVTAFGNATVIVSGGGGNAVDFEALPGQSANGFAVLSDTTGNYVSSGFNTNPTVIVSGGGGNGVDNSRAWNSQETLVNTSNNWVSGGLIDNAADYGGIGNSFFASGLTDQVTLSGTSGDYVFAGARQDLVQVNNSFQTGVTTTNTSVVDVSGGFEDNVTNLGGVQDLIASGGAQINSDTLGGTTIEFLHGVGTSANAYVAPGSTGLFIQGPGTSLSATGGPGSQMAFLSEQQAFSMLARDIFGDFLGSGAQDGSIMAGKGGGMSMLTDQPTVSMGAVLPDSGSHTPPGIALLRG